MAVILSILLAGAAMLPTNLPQQHSPCRKAREPITEAQEILLAPYAHVEQSAGLEISGIARSRFHENSYWIINDSGNLPAIIPVDGNGRIISEDGKGIMISGMTNRDWEELAIDERGNLYICDIGNNFNNRKDLAIYVVKEDSRNPGIEASFRKIPVRYPEQTTFSNLQPMFDAEAAFIFQGTFYLLTKRWNDTTTSLYSLDIEAAGNSMNDLQYRCNFPVNGLVTAADISPDERTLAILTYNALWIFSDFSGDDFFNGTIRKIPLRRAGQIESICFSDSRTLLAINENSNEMFRIPLPDDSYAEKRERMAPASDPLLK